MIVSVSYERLYGSSSTRRMGQYENERIGCVVAVETTVEAAFAEARAEVEAENERREAEYAEAERVRREAYEERRTGRGVLGSPEGDLDL